MDNIKIGVIGLGYIGLPLARLFSTKYKTIGYDYNEHRVETLMGGHDYTNEVSDELLQSAIDNGFECTTDVDKIMDCNFYVIAVPTPVDINHKPDLKLIKEASFIVGTILSKGDIVVYESTVYPGVTEDICVPILEYSSGFKYNDEFFVGYSPERINPGDKEHTVEKILKITSGSNNDVANTIDEIYNSVLTNGTYKASSIKVAEAAKVIENAQRDVNIAFVNELSKIFNAMGIDTYEVLRAAVTKWNFINMKPGLVGGHCISVDPYYLMEQAKTYGVNPMLISSARETNDKMGEYVANSVIKCMNKKGIMVKDSSILVLGFTFKENCLDIRNTKVVDIYNTLHEYTDNISVYDPHANSLSVEKEYGLHLDTDALDKKYDAIILAVSHNEFIDINYEALKKNSMSVIYDVKGVIEKNIVDGRL